MKKRERVFAAMKHEPVDRIPCYFTTHFAREAAFGQAAVEEHLKFFREVNPDIQKIMNEHLVPNMGSIKTAEDWKCIRTITLKDKFMEDEIELVKRVLDRATGTPLISVPFTASWLPPSTPLNRITAICRCGSCSAAI